MRAVEWYCVLDFTRGKSKVVYLGISRKEAEGVAVDGTVSATGSSSDHAQYVAEIKAMQERAKGLHDFASGKRQRPPARSWLANNMRDALNTGQKRVRIDYTLETNGDDDVALQQGDVLPRKTDKEAEAGRREGESP